MKAKAKNKPVEEPITMPEKDIKIAPPEEAYLDDLEFIFKILPSHVGQKGRDLIEKAYYFAYEAHRGRERYSKEPYFVHCIEVAKILAQLHLDPLAIAGGFLHDVVEDTNIPLRDIESEFGEDVALLVDGVTKIGSLRFESFEVRQAANIRKMLLSMSKDIRVILIKFADRLHNMRTIQYLPESSQKRIAQETIDVYAPLAHRFGINRIKSELEDLAFKVLHYDDYRETAERVDIRKEEREAYVQEAIIPIQKELKKFGIQSVVQGRAKHLYSIYKKIREREVTFEEVLDLLAVRIIVEKVEECYFVLGVVHNLWRPMPKFFKDYIADPKPNMYQSLHTKVVGPNNRMLEIQIRTREMHAIAEEGIAAHWAYKEQSGWDGKLDKHISWVRQFLDWQSESSTPTEFMETLRDDLVSDEVLVFTPRGRVIDLPTGATPIDFAFAVHTDVGLHCIGAKVNNRIVPLNTELQQGDTVEIITSTKQKPSQDWLRYVVSARAKSKIKKWLRESQLDQSIKLGQELLSRELNKLHIKLDNEQMNKFVDDNSYTTVDALYAALGNGDLSVQTFINKLEEQKIVPAHGIGPIQRVIRRVKRSESGIKIQGMDDLLITFAECCRPLPGDKIIGFITTGKGVSVHRVDCKNARWLMTETDRDIAVEWDVDQDQEFNARVRLLAEDRRHLLRDLTQTIAPLEVNMIDLDMRTEGSLVMGTIVVQVKNLTHLTKLIRRIQDVKGILSVSRLDEEITEEESPTRKTNND